MTRLKENSICSLPGFCILCQFEVLRLIVQYAEFINNKQYKEGTCYLVNRTEDSVKAELIDNNRT